jgi:NADPH-dependent curcumin reductase CurA
MANAWFLVSRPSGIPTLENFSLRETPNTPLAIGQVRVANRWLSVDPLMRGRMSDAKSYVPPYSLDAPMEGGAVGEVIESRSDTVKIGDRVLHDAGWRDESVVSADQITKIDAALGAPDSAWLGVLGLTGTTAWFGLTVIAEARPGDVVFVSAAAGAVGSAVVQIAKAKGMTVVGSAGGPEKCAWVRDIGADSVVDYKADGPMVRKLREAAPKGIDVFFDNVGGEHLDAAIAAARLHARFALCGMIDVYNEPKPTQLRYAAKIIGARIQIRGFIVYDFDDRLPEARKELAALLSTGRLKIRETIQHGLGAMPNAFLGLFSGQNTGKMLVKLIN